MAIVSRILGTAGEPSIFRTFWVVEEAPSLTCPLQSSPTLPSLIPECTCLVAGCLSSWMTSKWPHTRRSGSVPTHWLVSTWVWPPRDWRGLQRAVGGWSSLAPRAVWGVQGEKLLLRPVPLEPTRSSRWSECSERCSCFPRFE